MDLAAGGHRVLVFAGMGEEVDAEAVCRLEKALCEAMKTTSVLENSKERSCI